MIFLVPALAVMALQAEAWTWTLYEDQSGPVVLANELPDSPRLKATIQCDARSGVARVSVYGTDAVQPGFATITAGDGPAKATVEAAAARDGALTLAVRTDHPVFAQFITGGVMTVSLGTSRRTIEVQRPHLAKLQRFAELCGG